MLERTLTSNLLRFLKRNMRSLPHHYHVRFNKQLQSLNLDSLDALEALRLIREVQLLRKHWTWNVSLRIFLVFAELFTSIVWLILGSVAAIGGLYVVCLGTAIGCGKILMGGHYSVVDVIPSVIFVFPIWLGVHFIIFAGWYKYLCFCCRWARYPLSRLFYLREKKFLVIFLSMLMIFGYCRMYLFDYPVEVYICLSAAIGLGMKKIFVYLTESGLIKDSS